MKLTCVIVDDEYLALRVLRLLITSFAELTLLAEFKNAPEAFEYVEKNKVDLLLLDIQMPALNGLDFVKQLSYQPLVIFTTARHEYAVVAYQLDVLDYLVKPIAPDRFEKAIKKALQLHQYQLKPPDEKLVLPYIIIKSDYRLVQIPFDDIIFIESMNEYIRIHTAEKKYTTLAALKDMEQQLPRQQFVRIHKSFVVARKSIESYNTTSVCLHKKVTLPVGRKYKERFLQLMST